MGSDGSNRRKRCHSVYATGARAIGVPGCPEFAFWIASIDSVRIVLMQSWSMSVSMTSIDPIDSRSRLDAGDRALTVVGYPGRVAGNRYGARPAADRDRVPTGFAALDVDAADRVVLRVGVPDEAG